MGRSRGRLNSAPDVVEGVLYFGAGEGGVFALVADTGDLQVQHFNSGSQFIRVWGQPGPEVGQIFDTFDIEVDSQGLVFVHDDVRNDAQKFDADGTFVLWFGGPGSAPGQLDLQGK